MNSFQKYLERKNKTNSILCVGIDPDPSKINKIYGVGIDAIETFCIDLIDSSKDLACAYKINFAFFEQFGPKAYSLIEKIKDHIPKEIFTIADAKRGDIGNTAKAYARSIFDYFDFDSVTVNPYMGQDSILPFLDWSDKMTIILALTSNPGSSDFQQQKIDGEELFLKVTGTFSEAKGYTNRSVGFVYGATKPEQIAQARKITSDNLFLIPGVGAQGGDINSVLKANGGGEVLINVSRGISYPYSKDENISKEEIKNRIKQRAKEYYDLFNNALQK
jgi:orotidine-5'-phosphate decarboxylase